MPIISGVEVTNLETKTTYPSLTIAAKILGVNRKSLLNYFYLKNPQPVLGKYIFKSLGSKDIAAIPSDRRDRSAATATKV